MITITLNNLNLSSGDYSVNTIQHDSGTPLSLNTLEVAREDGVKLISTNYSAKRFTIEGLIKGDTQQELEYNLDTFKKTISGSALNLDIDYGYSRTRRYVVAVTNIAITREHFNLTFAPYSIELEVQDPPFGLETSEEEVFSGNAFTLPSETFSCVFSGTAEPKPEIEMTIDTVGSLSGISLKNSTTNTQMDIYTAWNDSDVLDIDTVNKAVRKSGEDVEFEGVFPECELGLNNWQMNLELANELLLSQISYTNESSVYKSNYYKAQSFLGQSGINYIKLELLIRAEVENYADVMVRIETDNSNKPSGTLANANATKTISPSLGTSWYTFEFPASFTLTDTKYWIVVRPVPDPTLGMGDGFYVKCNTSNPYADYNWAYSRDSGSTWTQATNYDMVFKIYQYIAPDFSVDTKVKYTRRYL